MYERGNGIADRLISFFQLSNTIPELKRRLFIILQSAGIFILLFVTAFSLVFQLDWFNLFANLLMLVFLCLMTWRLWRHRDHQELIVFLVFFGSAAWLLMVMSYNIMLEPSQVLASSFMRVVSPWFIWLILIYMVCFLTFRATSAFRMSLLLSTMGMAILLLSLFRAQALSARSLYDFVLLSIANLFVIVMAFPLALSQERSGETDFLTGLANRNRGYNAITSEIERSKRYNETFSVILFDLDHFKKINDTFGHPSGDAILREVTAFIGEHTRRADLFCRWGGEEFLLMMPHSDLASARLKAEHLRQQLSNRLFYKSIRLTASFGATTYYPYDSANSILERVDAALYRAKRNGRNCIEVD